MCKLCNTPWEDAFNRMRPEERRIVLKIADQLGKKQYYNALCWVGDLTTEYVRGLKELQEVLNK